MEVKTSTKEKFHVITVITPHLTANMTAQLNEGLFALLQTNIRNIVLNLKAVSKIDEEAAEALVKMQQMFYEQSSSFVICELQPDVESFLDEKDLLEIINSTPTESEAGDIVQMEEIERELFNDEDE
jgi:anti-anti-sigma factor